MTTSTPPSDKPEETPRVTAVDLSRVIRRFAHIFGSGELGNLSTSEALSDLAEFLQGLGATPVSELRQSRKVDRSKKTPPLPANFMGLSLSDLETLLEDETISKSTLIYIGRARFGMPESRLRRLPTAEVIEAVRAAAAHEQSLAVIEKNAEVSGRARQS
jgi:hypothetical protein